MAQLAEKYQLYRHTQAKLKGLESTLSTDAGCIVGDSLVVQTQMVRVLLWLQAARVQRAMAGIEEPQATTQLIVQLELAIHAMTLRKNVAKLAPGLRPEHFALLSEVDMDHGASKTKKTISRGTKRQKKKGKTKAVKTDQQKRWKMVQEAEAFLSLFADQELAGYLRMTDNRFMNEVRMIITRTVQSLCPGAAVSSSNPMLKSTQLGGSSKSKKKASKQQPTDGRLNVRLERGQEPWRNGYRLQRSDEFDGGDDDCDGGQSGVFNNHDQTRNYQSLLRVADRRRKGTRRWKKNLRPRPFPGELGSGWD